MHCQSRDHSIHYKWSMSPCVYLAPSWRYGASKIMGSRLWPFVVTWRHRSRDHSTSGGQLPFRGPWWPWVHLAPLRKYGASKIMGKGQGKGEGEGKGDGEGEGKGEGKWRRGKRKGKGKEKGKGKRKGKERWKEDSLRHVGRTNASTDAWTQRWFYTPSNAMHCIGQIISQILTCFKNFLSIFPAVNLQLSVINISITT